MRCDIDVGAYKCLLCMYVRKNCSLKRKLSMFCAISKFIIPPQKKWTLLSTNVTM